MKFYWCSKTRAVRIAWMLEELNLEHDRVLVDIRDEKAPLPDGFLEASPMGKVPAIADGENKLSESAAICLYLADRYSSGTLAPALDADSRGRFLYWMFFAPAVIEPSTGEKISGAEGNRFSHGWGDWPTMITTLQAGLGDSPWILGESFSAADVMVGGSVVFLKMFNMLPESATLEAYAQRCMERPAHQRAQALDG